jgi:hypothetical protein
MKLLQFEARTLRDLQKKNQLVIITTRFLQAL